MREFSGGKPDFAEDTVSPSIPDLLSKSVRFSGLLLLTSLSTEDKFELETVTGSRMTEYF
jgi:hypothetical protein